MTELMHDPATYRWVFVIACWALVGMAWLVAGDEARGRRAEQAKAAQWRAYAGTLADELTVRDRQDAARAAEWGRAS